MGGFSLWHWLIVGLVILLLFGKGRFSDMMGDVAKVSGRPGTSRRPAGRTQPASISTSSVPLEIWTPRIASISARLTGS